MSTKRKKGPTAGVVSLDLSELDAILERIAPVIAQDDLRQLMSLLHTLVEVTRLARERGATLVRLRRMLGQVSSEKTAKVAGAREAAAAPTTPTPPSDGTSEASTPTEPPSAAPSKPANDVAKPRRKGHGRIANSEYASKVTAVAHPTLRTGQSCPKCAHGSLYALKQPASSTRIVGQVPLVALRWDCECLRCSGCEHVFTAPLPEQARGPKYSESAASMIVVNHYGMGMPWNRSAKMQRYFGVPVPASTQWEVALEHVEEVLPVYDLLGSLAANAPVLHIDDTYVKILDLMGKRRAELVEAGELELPERTGLFTSGLVAKTPWGPIALFGSGRAHAGENLADLLARRDPELPTPTLMCDGLDRNVPAEHDVVLANCLAHARRHVVDEVGNHPTLCAHLLDEVGKVFANDARCARAGVSLDERLDFHQRESGPVMKDLHAWMKQLLDDKKVEENSGLGGALRYMLKRWDALTLFLRVAGAPLDNNMSERSLKNAIRHRRASLFYRSTKGAFVGDVYMALIFTTQLHGGDPFRYLTALFTNYKDVRAAPADWLPWNYEAAIARAAQCQARAA